MRQEHWARVKRLFEAALEKPAGERGDFLDGISGLRPELRAEVERLLTANQEDSFLERSPWPVATEEPGERGEDAAPEELAERHQRIGAYRLLEVIGRGGMGTVHLAVRDDDHYKRRVAIKLLRKGVDNEDILRRFRNERQILAAVEHPNIAKLYDGGSTEDGQPYFVMELVEGRPLDEYCDAHRVSVTERLQLFRKVCAAVQLAHQNLVIHRDLKPGNILVGGDGEPKLLDFGIAKLLNPELSADTLEATALHQRLMTPAYASPEQVRGEPITTASDVYSLGVILYVLLTGHRPYQFSNSSLEELTRVVCEQEPTRPSQMIGRTEEVTAGEGTAKKLTPETVSSQRAESADRLRRKLSGDLDNIVMMALRKEPQRRYGSVEQLSEDIRRHLEGHPVRARKPTLAYRGSKFIRRNRVSLAVAILFMVSIISFTIVTVQARARAEREALKAEAINDFMQETLAAADPISGVGREVTVVEALGKAVQELEGSFSSEPEVRAAIQKRIGMTYLQLGRFEEAEPLLLAALETRKRLFGERHAEVADSLDDLAELRDAQGNSEESERLFREALGLHRELPDQGEQVAHDLNGLAMVLYAKGEFDAAEPLQREAIALQRERSGEETRDFSANVNNLALIMEARGDLEAAEKLYRQSLGIDRKLLGDEHPNVATTLFNLGVLLRLTGGQDRAEPVLREALRIRRKALGEHPDTAASLDSLGTLSRD